MKVIIPIGISGSGKSTYCQDMIEGMEVICPDQIRYELTGNISDQSKNKEVFEEVDKRVKKCIEEGKDFYYDATNVNTKYRREFMCKIKGNPDVHVTYIYFPANVIVSYKRIKKDMEEGKNRSNVPLDVLYRQYNMFYESIFNNDWRKEGADEAILIDDKEHTQHYNEKLEGKSFTRRITFPS